MNWRALCPALCEYPLYSPQADAQPGPGLHVCCLALVSPIPLSACCLLDPESIVVSRMATIPVFRGPLSSEKADIVHTEATYNLVTVSTDFIAIQQGLSHGCASYYVSALKAYFPHL